MPRLRCTNAPTTASLFVQLSMRRQPAAGGLAILDLLLPLPRRVVSAPSIRAHHIASARRTASTAAAYSAPNNRPLGSSTPHRTLPTSPTTRLGAPARAFSVSSPWRATHALFNPQVDDDGKEMVLEITPRAADRLAKIMTKDSNPHLALRIQVESGGCHGFQYLMKLVTLPPSLPSETDSSTATSGGGEGDASVAIGEDDTIFTYAPDDSPSPGDLTAPKIILDLPSLELLKGSKVDFTMELIGSQFKIVDNPLATSSCGCGTSFDIKI